MENLGSGSGAREGGEGSERVKRLFRRDFSFQQPHRCRAGALAVIATSGRWDVLAAKDVWPCLCLYVLYKYEYDTCNLP